jgi:hypothetical protein
MYIWIIPLNIHPTPTATTAHGVALNQTTHNPHSPAVYADPASFAIGFGTVRFGVVLDKGVDDVYVTSVDVNTSTHIVFYGEVCYISCTRNTDSWVQISINIGTIIAQNP